MVELKDIYNTFQLPILFHKHNCFELSTSIIEDLELTNSTKDDIFMQTIQPHTIWGETLICEWAKHCTNDVKYLRDTQKILQKWTIEDKTLCTDVNNSGEGNKDENTNANISEAQENSDFANKVWQTWSKIKNDRYFKHNSGFIDFYGCQWLNESEMFLLCLSLYNMSSPILAILMPFLMLLMPFFYLQVSGETITMESYLNVLKDVSAGNAIGRLIFNFYDSSMEDRVYMSLSAGFYLFSFYQNFLFCVKFCNNLFTINTDLMLLRDHLTLCTNNMNRLSDIIDTNQLVTYQTFQQTFHHQKATIMTILSLLNSIKPFKYRYQNIMELGTVMKTYYVIFQKEEYINALTYSFGFQGYIDILHGLKRRIISKQLSPAVFKTSSTTNKKSKQVVNTIMKRAYYAGLINSADPIVENDLVFKKNMLLTGPNASGKTTIIKASLINIIFTQQFGYGCYQKCILKPYDFIHCYINITDNMGRDSLFQTESKKCLAIIDKLKSDPKKRHFCAFDELFSGTNPKEAVKCGQAYVEYLNKEKHRVDFILTTHYNDLCLKFEDNACISLTKMHVTEDKENKAYKYDYKMKSGINQIDGGVHVLKQLEFPEEIIQFVSF